MTPDPYWKTKESDRHVNPNKPLGTEDVVEFAVEPVLDFGCGTGRLAPHFTRYYGVDIAEHRVEEAKKRHPGKFFDVIEDVEDLGAMQYGSVIVDNVLIHVPDDEIRPMLKKFSEITTTVVVAEHLGRFWRGKRQQWHRDFEEYRELFGDVGLFPDAHREILNPRNNKPFSVMVWESA